MRALASRRWRAESLLAVVAALLPASCAASAGSGLSDGSYEEARATALRTSSDLLKDTRLTDRPLNLALRNPNLSSDEVVEVVGILLDRGARVNAMDAKGDTALICAARAGHVEAARVLIDAGADVDMVNMKGESAFSLALARADTPLADLLLEQGAQRDTRNNKNESPLYLVALNGDAQEVDRLLALGAPLEIRGKTALMGACAGGHLELARHLVEGRGAQVTTATGFGETAATFAAESGRLDLVDYLVSRGATCRSGRRTPLMAAAAGGHLDVVERLLALGVDPDQAARGQVPAIVHSAVRKHEAVTCRLLEVSRALPTKLEVDDATLRAAGYETIGDCLIGAGRTDEAAGYLEHSALAHEEASLEYEELAEEYEAKVRREKIGRFLARRGRGRPSGARGPERPEPSEAVRTALRSADGEREQPDAGPVPRPLRPRACHGPTERRDRGLSSPDGLPPDAVALRGGEGGQVRGRRPGGPQGPAVPARTGRVPEGQGRRAPAPLTRGVSFRRPSNPSDEVDP